MSDTTGSAGPVEPTARQRLQATREALMHELVPSTRASSPRRPPPQRLAVAGAGPDTTGTSAEILDHETEPDTGSPASAASGWFAVARHSVHAWWDAHPVRLVGVIAEPVLAQYARKRPLKLVGIAAGVGAAVVVTRPWRMISVSGLLVAALKSAQVSNFALSFLTNRRNGGR